MDKPKTRTRRLFAGLAITGAALAGALALAPLTLAGSNAAAPLPAAFTQPQKGPAVTANQQTIPFGGDWQLTHLRAPGGELAGLDADLVAGSHIAIGADGKLTGTVGCNRFGTSFSLDDSTIAFTGVIATRKACFGPVWDAERGLFTAFRQATAYELDGDTLVLRDAGGEEIARFARA